MFGKTFPALFNTTLLVRKRCDLHFYSAKGLRESGAFSSLTHYIFTSFPLFAAFPKRKVKLLPIPTSIAFCHAYRLTSVLSIIAVNNY